MKISLLVYNLSGNCLVRTYPIAKVLERHYEIELIGPAFQGDVFEPYQGEFCYKADRYEQNWQDTRWKRIFSLPRGIVKPLSMVSGDVVYAFKPRPSSFGVGLLAKAIGGRPLVLDIDDWEAYDYYSASMWQKSRKLISVGDPANPWYSRLLEPLTKFTDEITVVSSFLQNRFGGVLLRQSADCSFFDPNNFDRDELRRRWGFEDKKVVLFTGKATPHKGLKELIDALELIDSSDIVLMIVGPANKYLEDIKKSTRAGLILYIPPQPHELMPEFLSLADLVVLPQKDTPFAAAQVPFKLSEAMAMAKPIIATKISDIPDLLQDCGWIAESANPELLARMIQNVLDRPSDAIRMGENARKKCMEFYSWDAMEKALLGVFNRFE